MATAKDGVWLDHESGKIVKSQPSRGRQIVAPGKEMTPKLEALVDLYEANTDTRSVETATAPPAPETRTAPAKKATAKKAPAKKGS